ncbi:hypothetical protein [Mucilaginibacter ginsenosidivorans]|uniref:Uncharacterized protein n=1 Tax=Mucilaginibacter ginsenosidivorans TaxID=398053 RepID=A0A5B8USC3_9SPHI|nr:hypothetical protein [Mucilaginibacter ginsenosidivorans]QEC61934.1 hypothetical protein FRZ54_04820 [Mucilaginibacter ginsenosidivorans]
MKKALLLLALIAIGSGLAVVLLYGFSSKPNERRNGFNRQRAIPHLKPKYLSWQVNGATDIAGATDDELFFQTSDPTQIIRTSDDFSSIKMVYLPMQANTSLQSNFRIVIDDAHTFVYASNMPAIYCINLKTGAINCHWLLRKFSRGIALDTSRYIVRALDTGLGDQVIESVNIDKNTEVPFKNILECKHDAGFSTDGLLLYDQSSHLLIYKYFYANRFVTFDTCLLHISRHTTIDTNFTLPDNGKKMSKAGYRPTYTLSAAPIFSTITSCLDDGILYCSSALQADNERTSDFLSNSVIDCYNAVTGIYRGSFYVPRQKGEQVVHIFARNRRIIALYSHCVAVYQLP